MRRALRVLGILFVMYLLQTTAFHHFAIFGVQPDLMAVAIVCLCLDGDTYTGFCAGAVTGLLLDAMIGHVAIIYLLFYPLLGYLSAAIPKAIWKRWDQIPFQFLLAPVITLLVVALKEGMMLAYIYLNGDDLVFSLNIRAVIIPLYSAVMALIAQWPIRWALYREPRRTRRKAM